MVSSYKGNGKIKLGEEKAKSRNSCEIEETNAVCDASLGPTLACPFPKSGQEPLFGIARAVNLR
jgi:hypothetical protein